MQEDQTAKPSQVTVEDLAARYVAGTRLTLQEVAIIKNSREETEECVATVKRLVAEEACSVKA